MSSIFERGNKLYACIQAVDGTWKQLSTGCSVNQRAEAERWVAAKEREVAAARAGLDPAFKPMTVTRYADEWLDKRTNVTAADDRTRLTKHVLPRIGHLLMTDVRPRHIRDLVLALRNEGKLAPATIRQVSGLLHTMFKSAVIEELIPANPVQLERGVLPKKVDKDPTWRHQAIYTRAETEQLISDERILADRRVLYALKSLAALRHTEAATLTWSQYDKVASPLGAINLAETKNGVPRRMPVHPTLAKILATWKLTGWRELYGRNPKPEDLIVPTRNLTAREAAEAQKQLIADLGALELRTKAGAKQHRRGHDMRRTFITIARADGARPDILRWCTHGPKPGEMTDLYSSFDWPTLCAEVAKLRIDLREGKLVEMPKVAIAGAPVSGSHEPLRAVFVQSRKMGARGGFDTFKGRPQRTEIHSKPQRSHPFEVPRRRPRRCSEDRWIAAIVDGAELKTDSKFVAEMPYMKSSPELTDAQETSRILSKNEPDLT